MKMEEWKECKLGEIAHFTTGKLNSNESWINSDVSDNFEIVSQNLLIGNENINSNSSNESDYDDYEDINFITKRLIIIEMN